jgi:NAD(P)H dehydrogenase (quinone)
MIVVTGATGQLGQLVIDGLLQRVPAEQVVAAVRTPAKAAPMAARGVTVRAADYNEPAQLSAALAGADRGLLISGKDPASRWPSTPPSWRPPGRPESACSPSPACGTPTPRRC